MILVSSSHHDDAVDRTSGKPDMILDYNASKGGVDTVDKLCASYNCARNTRRWLMVIFYSVLNVAGNNSMVLYFTNNSEIRIPKREFLRSLSFLLIETHLKIRAQLQNIPKTMKEK